jgi:ketosteroid isomerase-like protein
LNENDQRRRTNNEPFDKLRAGHWSLVVRRWSLFTKENLMPKQATKYLLCLIAILLAACQGADATAVPDPAAVMADYTAAINAHDLEKALSLVADDAVYSRAAGDFRGKEEIRGFIQDLIDRDVRVELVGERQVSGERVTWTSRVSLRDPQNPDGPRLEIVNQSESTVRNGKIVAHSAQRAP